MRRAVFTALVLAACAPIEGPPPDLLRVDPEDVGLSTPALDSIADFLTAKVAEDAFPGGDRPRPRFGARSRSDEGEVELDRTAPEVLGRDGHGH